MELEQYKNGIAKFWKPINDRYSFFCKEKVATLYPGPPKVDKSADELPRTDLASKAVLYGLEQLGKYVLRGHLHMNACHPSPQLQGGKISRKTSHTLQTKLLQLSKDADVKRPGNEPRGAAEDLTGACESPVRWLQKQQGASDRCMARNMTRVTR